MRAAHLSTTQHGPVRIVLIAFAALALALLGSFAPADADQDILGDTAMSDAAQSGTALAGTADDTAATTAAAPTVRTLNGTRPLARTGGVHHENVITGVTLDPPDQIVGLNRPVVVQATWEAPDSAKGGDTFSLKLPDEMTGLGVHADRRTILVWHETETDVQVGTCELEDTQVLCTFLDSINDRVDVKGKLGFTVIAKELEDGKPIVWDDEFIMDLPDPKPGTPGKSNTYKAGNITTDGIKYVIRMGPDLMNNGMFPVGAPLTVTDTWDPSTMTLRTKADGKPRVQIDSAPEWDPDSGQKADWTYYGGATISSGTDDATGKSTLTIAFPEDLDRSLVYNIQYTLDPVVGVPADTEFTNNWSVNSYIGNSVVRTWQKPWGIGSGVNPQVPEGGVSWTKTDPAGKALDGSTWEIRSKDGSQPTRTVVDNDATDDNPEAGGFSVSGLPVGDYEVVETVAPVGYVLDPTPKPFSITADKLSFVFDVHFVNDPEEAPKGDLAWTKVNEQSQALAGSEWKLEGPDGYSMDIVDNGNGDADPADGALKVVDLPLGSYTLTETKAPEGYSRDATPRTLEITESAASASFGEIVNKPSTSYRLARTGGTKASPLAKTGAEVAPFAAMSIGCLAAGGLALAIAAANRRRYVGSHGGATKTPYRGRH